jgi:hypothetical protein
MTVSTAISKNRLLQIARTNVVIPLKQFEAVISKTDTR